MKKFIISAVFILLFADMFSQTYSFSSIPENLKSRADAVIRTDQCQFTLIKPGNAVVKYKKAITLLNDNSRPYRLLMVNYNKYSRINSLKGAVYDEKGKMIREFGMLDSYDMSAVTGGTFYSDDRMKVLYFPAYKYPYTIEYEYEISYSSLISYNNWYFHESPRVSVERSGIQYVIPKNLRFRFYGENLSNDVDSVVSGDSKIYTWLEENMPAIPVQQYFVATEYNLPVLHTAPVDFEYGGYKGSMTSWNSFGGWVYNLIKGQDELPQNDIDSVMKIISVTSDKWERAKKIYEFMQSKTRYVSIQIGIGGFKPANAMSVSLNGYGDCKALVNYTQALMNVAGIKSYYSLVKAGEQKDINKNFVDNEFNHAILCVLIEKDTVWLDCTDQTHPFNFPGIFTSGKYALVISQKGGVLVKTPDFSDNGNILSRTGSVYLNILGASSCKISNRYSGYYYELASDEFAKQSENEIKRSISASLRFADSKVTGVSYNEENKDKASSRLVYDISVNNFAVSSGERLYFSPSLTKEGYIQDYPSDLIVEESMTVSDSIVYNLPLGYKAEYIPENVSLRNEFGEFRYNVVVNGDRIVYKRYSNIKKSVIPEEKFSDFRTFINSIAKTDRQMIILTKKSV